MPDNSVRKVPPSPQDIITEGALCAYVHPARWVSLSLGAYIEANEDTWFDVVEQDADWAELCQKRFFTSDRVSVFVRQIIQTEYQPGAGVTNMYQDFASVVDGKVAL